MLILEPDQKDVLGRGNTSSTQEENFLQIICIWGSNEKTLILLSLFALFTLAMLLRSIKKRQQWKAEKSKETASKAKMRERKKKNFLAQWQQQLPNSLTHSLGYFSFLANYVASRLWES